MTRFLSLSLLALLSAVDPVKCHWQPTFSSAPTETAIPSPSPSDMPTVSPGPTITSQPTVTASSSPTITPVPTDSPTESPAPSPSPSEVPTNVPSVSPSMVPSSRPSYNPSSIPSDLPSLAPSKDPSAAPTSQPSSHPTLSRQPSSPPTDFPTVSSKKHSALVNFILGAVPGVMPEQQQVTFTTVAKEVIQNSLDTADDVSIEILYVQVKNQQFFPTASAGSNRRALQDKVVGILEIEIEVAAAITPGDYSGFQEMLEELVLDSSTDILIDDALKKIEAFFDFEPVSLSSQPDEDPSDEGTFSNGAMVGIATSCVVGIGLFFYQARQTHVRVASRRMKTASFTDESDEDDNHRTKDDYTNCEDPSGAFGGRSSYVTKDWDASSPQSIGDDTKFTTFSTNAVLNGRSNKNSSSLAKSMFCSSDNALTTNLSILHDLENPEDDSIEIAETSSDLVDMASCGCAAPKRERSYGAGISMAGNLILPQVREESSAYGGSEQAEDMGDEMTAIETILE